MNGIYDEIRIALHSIWTRRWLALAVAWGIAIAGWLVVSQMPNKYEAKSRVFVQMGQLLSAKVGINAQEQQNDIDTLRQTLTSAVNLEKVVRGTDLANTVSTPQEVADRVAGLQANIKIVAQQNNLFEITATASSPKLAQQIVQKLIGIFVDQNLADGRNDTQAALSFLDTQVEAMQRRLTDADMKRNAGAGLLPGTGSLQDRISLARTQMAQIDGDLAAAQTALSLITGQLAGTPPTIPGVGGAAGTSGPMRARLALLQGQLADALAKGYTESHPDVRALRSQMAAAQAAAAREPLVGGGTAGGQPNPQYLMLKSSQVEKQTTVASLIARKEQIQRSLDAVNSKVTGNPIATGEQDQADRDYAVLKAQYDKMLADREELSVRVQAQAGTDSIKFKVLDPARAPSAPTAPNRPLLLFGVLIAAIGAGIGGAFALSQLKATFATAGRLEKATGLPVIGSISERVSKVDADLRRRKLQLFGGATAMLVVAFVGLLSVEMLMRGLAA